MPHAENSNSFYWCSHFVLNGISRFLFFIKKITLVTVVNDLLFFIFLVLRPLKWLARGEIIHFSKFDVFITQLVSDSKTTQQSNMAVFVLNTDLFPAW